MASALQKLFRKRLNRQSSTQDGRGRELSPKANPVASNQLSNDSDRQYLTVSSLNSPSASSINRESFSSTSSAFPTFHSQIGLSRTASNHSAFRHRADSLDHTVRTTGQLTGIPPSRDYATTVDQFGSLVIKEGHPLAPISPIAPSQDEEDDIQSNVLYKVLTERLETMCTRDDVKILLIPSAKALDGLEDSALLETDSYLALHAFAASNLFKDRYQSVRDTSASLHVTKTSWDRMRATLTLQPEANAINVVLKWQEEGRRKEKHEERRLHVLSETSVYRSQASIVGSKRRERKKVRVLLIDSLVAYAPTTQHRRFSKSPASNASSKGTVKEPRAAAGKGAEEASSTLTFPVKDAQETTASRSSQGIVRIDPRHNFISDYLLLLDPPASLHELRPALQSALRTIKKNAADFTKSYVYVPGFDSYNASRIRRGILARAWHAFVEALPRNDDEQAGPIDLSPWTGSEGRSRLLSVFENVVLGHCHSKIYTSIRTLQLDADDRLDLIIATYHDHDVSLNDLGLQQQHGHDLFSACSTSQAILRSIGEPEEDLDWSLKHKGLGEIREMAALSPPLPDSYTAGPSATSLQARFRLRTPLDALDVMQATLDELSGASSKNPALKSRTGAANAKPMAMGADDLIPLLAYVLIRASPRKMSSLLYYTRMFGVSDATTPEHSWSLTMFEAVAQYLSTDPLRLCRQQEPVVDHYATVRSMDANRTLRSNESVAMERRASDQQHERGRRASLPSNALLSVRDMMPERRSIDEGSAASKEAPTAPFKHPGQPASQMLQQKGKKPALTSTASDRFGGFLVTPPEQASDGDVDAAAHHKRTMSLSSELLIRPQIIVRGASSGRSDSRSSISSRPLLSRNISSAASLAPTEGEFGRFEPRRTKKSASESWSLFGALSNYASSSKASFAEAEGAAVEEGGSAHASATVDTSLVGDRRSITTNSSGWLMGWANEWSGMSRAPSSTGVERQNSAASTSHSRPPSVRSQESGSAPLASVPVQAAGRAARSPSPLGFPGIDSMPSLEAHQSLPDSMAHDTTATVCSSPREPSSLLSSPSSVLSSPTYKSDQIFLKTTRGGSWSSTDQGPMMAATAAIGHRAVGTTKRNRTRSKVRSRLLSSPTPSEPLPPQITSEPVSVDLSTMKYNEAIDHRLPGAATAQHHEQFGRSPDAPVVSLRRRPKPVSTMSADQVLTPSSPTSSSSSFSTGHAMLSTSPAIQANPTILPSNGSDSRDSLALSAAFVADRETRRREPLQQTSSSSLNAMPFSTIAWPSGQALHTIKLQIPSPVDERTDPIGAQIASSS